MSVDPCSMLLGIALWMAAEALLAAALLAWRPALRRALVDVVQAAWARGPVW